jgi:preprotein translocase subunit SecG
MAKSKLSHRPVKLMSVRSKKRLARLWVVIAIFAVAFVIFLLFLRYITTERMPESDSGSTSSLVVLTTHQA